MSETARILGEEIQRVRAQRAAARELVRRYYMRCNCDTCPICEAAEAADIVCRECNPKSRVHAPPVVQVLACPVCDGLIRQIIAETEAYPVTVCVNGHRERLKT